MKETGESGLTKNKTVILLLIILLILIWFVGEILISYHWMKVNRYPVTVRNLPYTDTVTDAGFKMVVISDLHDHEFGKDSRSGDVSSKITADSVLDGDLTSNIKYSLEKTVNTQAAGEYPIEFKVMDSGGNTVYLKTQISISDKSYAGIDVKLKDYLIYLSVGDAFDPNAYFDSADKEGELTVQSNVNTAKAGS